MRPAYYNERDRVAAAWLRELIAYGLIAPGHVDERSIADVRPGDLAGYTQCHFFAGIGVWSYALRRAGWPDTRRVWTGSCPCQPFSNAGGRAGFDDERHLWPAFYQLIAQCRPSAVLGEQVASKDGLAWLDLVQSDMEAAGYAFGAADLCAAGVGAPHIRQRLWFVGSLAHVQVVGRQGQGRGAADEGQRGVAERGPACDLADTQRPGLQARAEGDVRGALGHDQGGLAGEPRQCRPLDLGHAPSGGLRIVGDAARAGCGGHADCADIPDRLSATDGLGTHWSDADWIWCRDEKYRPVEPGSFPLAHGSPARVGRLRGYGNAVVAQAAQTFIEATGRI